MSQVLVSPPPSMPPLAMANVEVLDCLPHQQQFHLSANVPQDAAFQEEKRMAGQLAHLASQHHTSEYNRLKFGPSGAPVVYIPLSIQLPMHVRDLKARQTQYTIQKAWWPANTPGKTRGDLASYDYPCGHTQTHIPEPFQQENVSPYTPPMYATSPEFQNAATHYSKVPPFINLPPTVNLQRELSVAMSSPLSIITIPQLSHHVAFQQSNLTLHAKTSQSHPINISPIVPFELLPLITSHLSPTPPHTSHMFDLPPSLLLHHLVTQTPTPPPEMVRPYPLMRVANGSLPGPVNDTGPPSPDQLPLAFNESPEPTLVTTELPTSTQNGHAQGSNIWLQNNGKSENILPSSNLLAPDPDKQKCQTTHSFLPLSPPSNQDRPQSAPPSLLSSPLMPLDISTSGISTSPPPLPEVVRAMASDILTSADDVETIATSNGISPPTGWTPDVASRLAPPLRPALGNLLLSSCPGKKVRLSGPVKGRGAICRDLGHDLRRVKALGVGCIVCCLDDEELDFLGASWCQYSEIARAVGLDVLRIPIPEGLAPTTPALFDQHLSHIIHSYTLQGIPVLVHCRGGVGRAGLVACCWMLKLGLCGRLRPVPQDTSAYWDGETTPFRKEAVELVERAITVVRRRRSVKAIETYEQVRFLVDFVEHLRAVSLC